MKLFIEFAFEVMLAGIGIVMFVRIAKANDEYFKLNAKNSFEEKVNVHF